jgi:tetratricopeptide (TPR) repeat protein
MAQAFRTTSGELVDRLMAALEAAQREGGDIRGRQSAAILVVRGRSSGSWWKDRLYDLRVEDDPAPLEELKRLIHLNKAYNHMNRGDELLADNKVAEAMEEYTRAMELVPGNAEMTFWPAVTLATIGRVEESFPLFRKVFALDPNWALLLPRLPQVGQFPKDRALLKKILALAPGKK